MLFKLENNSLIICPTNGVVNGESVSNFDKYLENNKKEALKLGYKQVVNKGMPENVDENTNIEVTYVDKGDYILANFTVKDNIK